VLRITLQPHGVYYARYTSSSRTLAIRCCPLEAARWACRKAWKISRRTRRELADLPTLAEILESINVDPRVFSELSHRRDVVQERRRTFERLRDLGYSIKETSLITGMRPSTICNGLRSRKKQRSKKNA